MIYENVLKDLYWLESRTLTAFNNFKILPVYALNTVCKMSGLKHQVIVTELKQF